MAEKVTYILQLRDLFTDALNKAKQKTDEFTDSVNGTQSALTSMAKGAAAAFAAVGFGMIYKDLQNVTREFDSLKISLDYISGGKGQATLEYLRNYSNELGISVESAASGYKTIAAAARGTNLEGVRTKEIFESVSAASAVLGLSNEQMEGSLLAVSQMMSKGKVQAEELRGQLGERIPGAFQIAARAMGMTTAELDKFMADGKLMAEDFLPRFAQQLKTEFAGGIQAASTSLNAEMNRMDNAILLFKQDLGNELKPVFLAVIQATLAFIEAIKASISWVKENKEVIATLAAGILIYTAYTNAAAIVTGIMTVATNLWTVAQWALNAAMSANPIGALILAITAVTAGVIYAWKNFAGFRGAVMGAWEVMKGLTGFIKDFVINVFTGLANVIAGVFTLDGDQIQKGLNQAVDAYRNFGKSAADAFNKGYSSGVEGFNQDQKAATPYAQPAGTTTAAKPLKPLPSATTGATTKVQGQKAVTINIDINSLVKEFKVVTTNIQEAPAKIKELITRAILDATNDAQIIGGQ